MRFLVLLFILITMNVQAYTEARVPLLSRSHKEYRSCKRYGTEDPPNKAYDRICKEGDTNVNMNTVCNFPLYKVRLSICFQNTIY